MPYNDFLGKINEINEASLVELAERVHAAHVGVGLAAANLVEHALAAGDALIRAKEIVGHGNWLAWLRRECDLSEDRAERYMRIARGRATLEANSARVRNLSLAGALQLLKQPRSRPTGKTEKQAATSLDALPWWSGASPEQRRHFLDGVGLTGVLAALPAGWQSMLEARLCGHLSAMQLIDLLESRLERDGIAATVPLQKLRKLIDRPKLIDLRVASAAGAA